MRDQLKTVLLLGALAVLIVALGDAVAPGYLPVFVVLALATNLGAYFFSDRVVLAMHGARELRPEQAPELFGMVRELCREAGLPMPRLALIHDPTPNAFATGRNPEHAVVAVTEGILHLLTPRELRAVLAHELGHVANRDILVSTIAAAMAAVVTGIASSLRWGLMLGMGSRDDNRSPLGALLLALVAPVAATLLQLGVSRSREYLADETGAHLCGDPEALASALAKLERGVHARPYEGDTSTASLFIVHPFQGSGGVGALFSTHPPTAARIERLLAMRRR